MIFAKKILRGFVGLIFNRFFMWPFVFFYDRILFLHLQEAWGFYLEKQIPGFPSTSKLFGRSVVTQPTNIKIGEYVRIGSNCYFFSNGGITVGDGTVISRNVVIYSGNHNVAADSLPYDNDYNYKAVKIGRGVWIGMGVVITPGVEIGDGAVIGMGTVVSKNVQAGEFVVGSTQRVIREREDGFQRLLDEKLYYARFWP